AELAEIRLGLPVISAELRGQFLPQMLNLDLLGGVAFDKGCYPGQEIIARAQNLGTVKRRLLRFTRDDGTLPAPGSELQDVARTAVGTVVRAARSTCGIELLAVIRLDAVRGPLATEDAPDLPLSVAGLPYTISGVDV
ncbi:MAG: tRNA-modifying protein YgfZ, partial [Gammaproteobacteria bacterium]|nr:tRNA-modifying protein YgfZ [Gammaproteobacteria bacterium]